MWGNFAKILPHQRDVGRYIHKNSAGGPVQKNCAAIMNIPLSIIDKDMGNIPEDLVVTK